jgi:hypothetical protein
LLAAYEAAPERGQVVAGGAPKLVYSRSVQYILFGSLAPRRKASRRPHVLASTQGTVLLRALVHLSGIIVAIGLVRQRRASGVAEASNVEDRQIDLAQACRVGDRVDLDDTNKVNTAK